MADTADTLPVPSPDNAKIVVAAPGDGPGYWAGGPSAVLADGRDLLARLPAPAAPRGAVGATPT